MDENSRSSRGSMYRPATVQTYDRIQRIMKDHELSWNSAVNFLVLQGIRAMDEASSASRRNEGRFIA